MADNEGPSGPDVQPISVLWPEPAEDAFPEDGTLSVVFEFEEADSKAGWDCTRITVEPLLDRSPSIDERTVRGIPLARLLRGARAGIWSLRILEGQILAGAHAEKGVPAEPPEWPPKIDRRGRRAVGPDGVRLPSRERMEHLRKVADVYNAEEKRNAPGRKRPVQAVVEAFGLSPDTASKQIARCRGLRLIGPPANRGNRRPRDKYPLQHLREVARIYNTARGSDPIAAVVESMEIEERSEADRLVAACRSEGLID